jgi:AcrR family transcriptional regulator
MSATRDDIIEAAARLMFNGGYVHTSIGVIAAEAGVAVQTIYNTVGSKADLLSAVLDRTAAGDAQPLLPSVLRARVAEARTAGDVLTVLADWFAEANRGTAAIDRVLSQAAAVDADAARLEQRRATQRLHSYGGAAGALRERRGPVVAPAARSGTVRAPSGGGPSNGHAARGQARAIYWKAGPLGPTSPTTL